MMFIFGGALINAIEHTANAEDELRVPVASERAPNGDTQFIFDIE